MIRFLTSRACLAVLAVAATAAAVWALARRPAQPAAATAPAPAKVYAVQKLLWIYTDRSVPRRESEPAGAGFPVKAFATREAAEAACADMNRAAKAGYGQPFQYGRGWGQSFPSLDDFTSTPTGEFIAWLEREGIAPPAGQKEAFEEWARQPREYAGFERKSFDAWQAWWDGAPVLTPEQRAKVLEKLDRVRYFEVVEVEVEVG